MNEEVERYVFAGMRKGVARFRKLKGTLSNGVFVSDSTYYGSMDHGATLGRAIGNRKRRILNEISILQTQSKELDRQYQELVTAKAEEVK